MLHLRINCDPLDENNDSTLGVESQPIPALLSSATFPPVHVLYTPDCPGIMPLKNPKVGDKSLQFSTDHPASSIYAEPAAGLSSLCQHIGGPWRVDSD
jgi:hypothetical protein